MESLKTCIEPKLLWLYNMHQKNYFVTLVKTNYIEGHITENKSFQITKVLRTLELLIVTEVF